MVWTLAFAQRDSFMPAIKYKVNSSNVEKLQLETLVYKEEKQAV
jgi:hypothetical protein